MIQRTLFRSVQAAARQSQSLPVRHTPSAFLATPLRSTSNTSSTISSQLAPFRRYSQEAEKKEEASAENKSTTQDSPATADTDAIKKELEAKKKEVTDLTGRVMRSVADYRNLQEQTKREVQAAKDFALQRFAKDLLDTIDNLDRALTTVPPEAVAEGAANANKDLVNLHAGLKMTESILLSTLRKHGLERFDPAEDAVRFDPNKMEATFQAPQPGKEDGTVFYTQSKGFTLNGRVLRAAKVGVVRNA